MTTLDPLRDLVVSGTTFGGLVRVMGGGSREPGGNPGVPSLVMAAEQYNWIIRLLGDAEQAAGEAPEAEAKEGAKEGAGKAETAEPES